MLGAGCIWGVLLLETSEVLGRGAEAVACLGEVLTVWPFFPKRPFRSSARVVELSFGSEENMRPVQILVHVALGDTVCHLASQ